MIELADVQAPHLCRKREIGWWPQWSMSPLDAPLQNGHNVRIVQSIKNQNEGGNEEFADQDLRHALRERHLLLRKWPLRLSQLGSNLWPISRRILCL